MSRASHSSPHREYLHHWRHADASGPGADAVCNGTAARPPCSRFFRPVARPTSRPCRCGSHMRACGDPGGRRRTKEPRGRPAVLRRFERRGNSRHAARVARHGQTRLAPRKTMAAPRESSQVKLATDWSRDGRFILSSSSTASIQRGPMTCGPWHSAKITSSSRSRTPVSRNVTASFAGWRMGGVHVK
jgi:hypothetical protein